MIRRPPRSTRTDTRVPDTTLSRSIRPIRSPRRVPLRPQHRVRQAPPQSRSRLQTRRRQPIRRPMRWRSEEHTSELQSLMRISYAVFCLKKKTKSAETPTDHNIIIPKPYDIHTNTNNKNQNIN